MCYMEAGIYYRQIIFFGGMLQVKLQLMHLSNIILCKQNSNNLPNIFLLQLILKLSHLLHELFHLQISVYWQDVQSTSMLHLDCALVNQHQKIICHLMMMLIDMLDTEIKKKQFLIIAALITEGEL